MLLWRVRLLGLGRAPSKLCCAARASCGCPTVTPLPSTGPTLANTSRSAMRVTGKTSLLVGIQDDAD